MSYEKACKRGMHKLRVGHTFNPSGLGYKAPKEKKVRDKRKNYAGALADTALRMIEDGEPSAKVRYWISTVAGLYTSREVWSIVKAKRKERGI